MEITKILAAVQRIIYWLLRPITFLLSLRPTTKIPPITSPYLQMSVTQIARKIRNGEIKSREVVDACIDRIKEVNPIINAIVQDRFKEAQEEANKADDYIAANRKNWEMIEKEKPLLGVPFTVKESCSLKGMSFVVGCVPLKGSLAADDGEVVKQVRNAGAIPLAITNTPELCMCWETNNLVTGRTRNPYNIHRTSGGSSGGEGAIIGSGASLFGIGSDLAGSIRVPAMFNGIFGHKPSPGQVSVIGHYPLIPEEKYHKYAGIGPMVRHSEDLSLLLKVMCGDNAGSLNLDEKVDLHKLNVYYVEEATNAWYVVPVDQEIKDRMRDAVLYLKTAYDTHVEKGPFEELAGSAVIASAVILGIQGMPNLLHLSTKKNKDRLNLHFEIIKAILGLSEFSVFGTTLNSVIHGKLYSKEEYERYYQINEDLKLKVQKVLKDNGVLLYPTFPVPAMPHNGILTMSCGTMYSMIVNALELPSTHVPLGLNKNGLPIGIQVVAAQNQDRLCIAVARALEERFGGWIPPSS